MTVEDKQSEFFPFSKYPLGGLSPIYDKLEVDDWFKRCIDEFPLDGEEKFVDVYLERLIDLEPLIYEYIQWFRKWFGQFKEET